MNIICRSVFLSFFIFSLVVSKPPHVAGNRTPSNPYISGDGFRSMANHVYDETDQSLQGDEVQLADIVFVKTDKLSTFFSQIHSHIKYPYILISHNADHSAPAEFESYLNDDKIIKWFGQNPTIMHHPKFVPIPIGLGNRYVGDHGNLANLKGFSLGSMTHKSCLLGYNFDGGRVERRPILQRFAPLDYVKNLLGWPHRGWLCRMSEAKYILSPRGNGLDCHRTWEAMIVGTIPILESSMLDELLEGLPVLIVNDWSEVNQELLEQLYPSLERKFNPEHLQKITYSYWQETLLNCQREARVQYLR